MPEESRLSLIDESNRDNHSWLASSDVCYHLFEYTSHRGYEFSKTNQLISNLKKKPSLRNQPGYSYKARAIASCSQGLAAALNSAWLAQATLVPVPGSKALDHPDYDNRMERVCRGLKVPPPDVRTLVKQTASVNASHEAPEGQRVKMEELLRIYEIDEGITLPLPTRLAIVDDVITAGTHYRAMHTVLSKRFPEVPIIGLFIARRVFPTFDFDPA